MAKMKEGSWAYKKEAIELAMSEITIYQCKTCGHPVKDGWVCGYCGESSPITVDQEPSFQHGF